ncbi:hypothetical protein Droror1_Dr00019865, partial [Drosera rotundifolia]
MGAVRVAPFSNRLAHAVPPNIQSLRCFANFEALRFSEPIHSLVEVMVHRMVEKSSKNGGKYVSIHLRFEKITLEILKELSKSRNRGEKPESNMQILTLQIVDCRVCGDPNSVLRFAFIEFTGEEGARNALSLSDTMLGFYPAKVLPSKTTIPPVNPTLLPR